LVFLLVTCFILDDSSLHPAVMPTHLVSFYQIHRNCSLILISPPVQQKKSVLVKSSTPPASIPPQTKRVSTPIQSLHVSNPPSTSLPGENVPTGSPSSLSWPASGSNSGTLPKGLAFRVTQTNLHYAEDPKQAEACRWPILRRHCLNTATTPILAQLCVTYSTMDHSGLLP
jgi:hypothetical protein